MSNVIVTGSTSNGIQIGSGIAAATRDVELANSSFTTTLAISGFGGIGADLSGSTNVSIHDTTFSNFGYVCVAAGITEAGTLNLSRNKCSGNNTGNKAGVAFVLANTGFSHITLDHNTVTNGSHPLPDLAVFGGSGDPATVEIIGNTGDVSAVANPTAHLSASQ